jgi:hypothetical protein
MTRWWHLTAGGIRRGVFDAESPGVAQVSGLLSAVVTLGDGSDGFGGLVSGVAAGS